MDLIKSYDYSSVIGESDRLEAIHTIDDIIASGHYFKNSPPYQTEENLFGRKEACWLKYRMTFLSSVFFYLGREARVSDMMAWCFKTNLSTVEDREKYWHHHHKHGALGMSGILYLQIPDDATDLSTCGTEIAPMGPEGHNKFYIGPNAFTWNVYPSETWHRPGIVQSNQYRYVLAADVVYYV
jgi:hypothetical protein